MGGAPRMTEGCEWLATRTTDGAPSRAERPCRSPDTSQLGRWGPGGRSGRKLMARELSVVVCDTSDGVHEAGGDTS